jgi:hyaluronoglucosaminidase
MMSDGPQIYAGVTGKFADDVNFSGSVVTSGRVVMLMEHSFGLYPRIVNGRAKNGGIPQNVDMSAHLARVRRDINTAIPDVNFTGFAIMDFEAWKPDWASPRIGDEYREASRRRVRLQNPGLSAAQIEARAAQEWNESARAFLSQTLAEVKRLRPDAVWGFYGYLGDHDDDNLFEGDMDWLWSEVDALFPSIYMRMVTERDWSRQRGTVAVGEARDRVRTKMDAALDVADGRPVVPFVWRLYKPQNPVRGGQPLSELDFQISFEYPLELGADGLILWDNINSRQQQRALENALEGQFGTRLVGLFGAAGSASVPAEQRRARD